MNEMFFVRSGDDKAEDVPPALKLLGPRDGWGRQPWNDRDEVRPFSLSMRVQI